MRGKAFHYIILFFAVFCLSTSAIFAKLSQAPAEITAFYRLFLVAISLFPTLFFHQRWKEFKNFTKRQWLLGVASGGLLAIHYVLWFTSLHYTSVASSTVLVTLQPLFSMVGGFFLFHERYGPKSILGCLIAICGCIIIAWGDFQISPAALLGDFMAFAAGAVMSGYFLVGQSVRSSLSVIPYSVLGYGSGALFLMLFAFITGASFTGYSIQTVGCFFGLAFLSTVLGQLIFNWLLKWLSATIISMSVLGESVFACLLCYFLLSEQIVLRQLVGMAVILFGLGLFLYQQSIRYKKEEDFKKKTEKDDVLIKTPLKKL